MKFYIVLSVNDGIATYSAGGDMTTGDINQAALFRVLTCARYDAENQTRHHRETGIRFDVDVATLDGKGNVQND